MRIKKTLAIVMLSLAVVALGGCPPLVVAGGAAAGVAANDERTAGSLVEDQGIEIKAAIAISREIGDQANISVVSYNRRVLIVGQTPTKELRRQAIAIISGIENVRETHDQLEISGAASLTARAADSALTVKVKAALCGLQIEGFSCLDVKIVTEQGVVYILGLVTKSQAANAVETARGVKGVKKVVKALEYKD